MRQESNKVRIYLRRAPAEPLDPSPPPVRLRASGRCDIIMITTGSPGAGSSDRPGGSRYSGPGGGDGVSTGSWCRHVGHVLITFSLSRGRKGRHVRERGAQVDQDAKPRGR
eukprot:SAG22_NODE_133_length_18379_cov_34.571937_11_plen_111_part_00